MSQAREPGDAHREWEDAYAASPLRDGPYETMSGVPVDPVYGDAPFPGEFPYTRGVYARCTARSSGRCGCSPGSAPPPTRTSASSALLDAGAHRAVDRVRPAHADGPRLRRPVVASAKSARPGVAVCTLADMEDLFAGIDLGTVTTSMTINGPAAVIMAMYIAVGDRTGVARADLGGHDPERHPQGVPGAEGVPLPAAAVDAPRHRRDALRDRGDAEVAPDLDQRVPHPGGGLHRRARAGVHARERLRLRRGRAGDRPRGRRLRAAPVVLLQQPPRLLRGDRQVPRRPPDLGPLDARRYGATDERSLRLRFHAQTSGVSLTAQQPENNIARGRAPGLAAVLGGAQSLHTDSFDEALALPSDKAARIALRTQQIIADETGVALVADPLGGSAYVEWMTDELERQAEEVFARLRDAGDGSMLEGVYAGIDDGWFVGEIADAAYRFELAARRRHAARRRRQRGDRRRRRRGQHTLYIGPEVEELQLKRLATVKSAGTTTPSPPRCAGRRRRRRHHREPDARVHRRRRRVRDRGRDRRRPRSGVRHLRREGRRLVPRPRGQVAIRRAANHRGSGVIGRTHSSSYASSLLPWPAGFSRPESQRTSAAGH